MSRRAAPTMPTAHQVKEINDMVVSLHPNARIVRVGPEGVIFNYPDAGAMQASKWANEPFTGAK